MGNVADLKLRNATIRNTMLGYEDHGIMTFMLYLDYGSLGQGFGGFALDSFVDAENTRVGSKFGMECIIGILQALQVESWEKLKNQPCRARIENGTVTAIGHFLEDRFFSPKELADRLEEGFAT